MQVAQLRIPPEHRAAVSALSKMPQEEVEALTAELKGADPSLRGVREAVGKHFDASSQSIASALVSLAMVLATQPGVEARELSDNVRESLAELEPDMAGAADLAPLLDSPTLLALTKTIDLRTGHERILQDFRIFTDIRPVFGNDLEEPISSVIVTHTAQITYGTSDRVEELFVALTHRDLKDLEKVVDRALLKEQRAEEFVNLRDGRVLDSHEEVKE